MTTKEFRMSQATLKQIQKLINSIESTQDLVALQHVLKARYNTIQCLTTMAFRKGQTVSFKSTRTGQPITGVIVKINTKTIHVNSPVGNYRVSPSLLKAA